MTINSLLDLRMCACIRACVRASERACVRACVWNLTENIYYVR